MRTLYQAKAEPLLPLAAGQDSVDKWQTPTNQPRKTLSALIPVALAFVPVISQPETITQDKWAQPQSRPVVTVKRPPQQPFFAENLSSVPSQTVSLYVTGQACEPTLIVSFQYQSEAKPLVVSTAPETITSDKWLTSWPQPSVRPKRLVQYGVNFAIAEQADNGLPPVYWFTETQRPTLNPRRSLYPTFSIDQATERVTIDKWLRQQTDRVDKVRRIFEGLYVRDLLSRVETVYSDKWQAVTNQPRQDLVRNQRLYPSAVSDTLHLIPGAEIITLDKWNRLSPDLIFRGKRLPNYAHFSIDPTLRAERASLDKWGQPLSLPRWDLKRQQAIYPSLAIDSQFYLIPPIEVIRLDKFGRHYPDLIFRAKRLSDYGQFSIDPTLRNESVSVDKWVSPDFHPRASKRLIVGGAQLLLVPESPTLDKWLQNNVQPRSVRRLLTTDSQVLFISETLTLDKWIGQSAEPIRRRAPLSDSLVIVPASLSLARIDWLLQQADIFRIRRLITHGAHLLLADLPVVISITYPTGVTIFDMSTGSTITLLDTESTIGVMDTETTLQ